MKLCRYDGNRVGLVVANRIHDVSEALAELPSLRWPVPPGDHFVRNFKRLEEKLSSLAEDSDGVPIESVSLLSPVANPSKIIAAPVNYAKHVAEARADAGINFGTDIKTIDQYGLFLKSSTSLVGPAEGIQLPNVDRRIDHEVEVVVVVGSECEAVSEGEALDVVHGYCLGLDMSVRGPEDRSWRKSFDTFTVLGPYIVTADEIGDPSDILMSLTVNEEKRQEASTSALIYSIPRLISYASQAYRLYPGDLIMTGTPEGVGPVAAGDELVARAPLLGEMRVRVGARTRDEMAA